MTRAHTLPQPLTREHAARGARHGLRTVLGAAAWSQLPAAVRERFADTSEDVTYAGSYEVVRASMLGRVFGWLGILFGMPVTPRSGACVAARVAVRHEERGVAWDREYLWPDGARHLVRSTKVVGDDARLVERLPARLCMPLHTYVEGAVLHFVSLGYYFDLRFGDLGPGFKVWVPRWLTPGVTHVEHIDLDHGWFRFTMTVTHPLFGEMFFQTGRFCATEDGP
jgi:uncharacterized protein DUF4166